MYPILLALIMVAGCKSSVKKIDDTLFSILPAIETGVDFNNSIVESDSLNMFVNEYTYMGGGVGIADFNNDGLQDIYFTGSQVSSKMYLNKGAFKFQDITEKAGVVTTGWCTGVSVIDINNDGWQDIYVCVSGKKAGVKNQNLLFINQHNLTFKEEATAYGLAISCFATQAVFFDYDKDGRLDMYLLNHTLTDNRPNDILDRKIDANAAGADKLFHNEGTPVGKGHAVYADVSLKAGIMEDGNGLGIVVSDYNGDGFPDLYVANDYIKNDLLWLNNKNGTFSNRIATAIKHQSYSSMGTDAADINNDGLPDIVTVDMQPETNERKKMMYSFLTDQRHQLEMQKGYEPEYIHNMLQLNNGTRMVNNQQEPFFSEIGEMAGIAETDWSWSVLMADFDNDGFKDIHIANGLGKDPTNIDFLEYRRNKVLGSGLPDNEPNQRKEIRNHLDSLGSLSLRNYLYQNNGDFTFKDISVSGGINQKSITNGVAWADLDNDGDLDLVTSNINSAAFIMRNDNIKNGADSNTRHQLTVQLAGDSLNKAGIGSIVYAYTKTGVQMVEQFPVRGYLSSVDQRLHFGFGSSTPDSVKIVWPDGKNQVITKNITDTTLLLSYKDAAKTVPDVQKLNSSFFTDITTQLNASFVHKENFFFDYSFQSLLQQKYSQEGPFISSGDVNGDGRGDFFIGGAFGQPGKVFIQNNNGSFSGKDLVTGTKNEEDMQSTLFDADGDKDLDLLVAGGSSEFEITSSFYRPRLYMNDGRGNFTLNDAAISPLIRTTAKCMATADMDGDGDIDVFIGGRVSLGIFPKPPVSYILRNDGGKFTDVTAAVCPALENAGLLNTASWTDIDNDKKPDLIIGGDWMPLKIFKNDGTTLKEIAGNNGLDSLTGFWRKLVVADVDKDGDLDIIAGNLGLNNPFHISTLQPAELVAKDFDGNGVVEPVFCYYIKDNNGIYKLSSGISRNEWSMQMPSIKKRYDHNSLYAKAGMDEIFTTEMMEGSTVLHCSEVRSGIFINNGKGVFTFKPLPQLAQVAPVNAIVLTDLNGDNENDIVLAGNEYQAQVTAGRYDASYGLVLLGSGKGVFTPMKPQASGLIIDGDVKDLKIITTGNKTILLAAINDAPMRAYQLNKTTNRLNN